MYIPPFTTILQNLGLSPDDFATAETISIPKSLFRFLFQLALVHGEFDEGGYLSANPDIAEAVQRDQIADPRLHYLSDGYFECRDGATPAVDEGWYMKAYPDVSRAFEMAQVASARQHFYEKGAGELRAPSAAFEVDAVEWGRAFGKVGANDLRRPDANNDQVVD